MVGFGLKQRARKDVLEALEILKALVDRNESDDSDD